jgi:hypothetical protein
MDATLSTAINIWTQIEGLLTPLLKNLDPSLFQNIILGILAIFIPFAIVFLTDLLGKSGQTRTEFEKMVWGEEVLGSKKVFWYSVAGLATLSFFSGTDVSLVRKLVAILVTLILVVIFGRSFKKILRFSEGYKPEFEINFLKKLKLAKILTFGNKLKKERMVRAWDSFWSEKSSHNERDFTKVFIDHIDDAIEQEQYYLVPLLAKAYQKNLDKRDQFSIGYEILPKMFEWHEKLWEMQQKWLRREDIKEKIQNSFSQKHFPTFKKWVHKLLSRSYSKPDYFWNWHYFQQEFFPAISKILLQGGIEPYQFFTSFKKYIDEAEARLEKIEDKDKKARWEGYILGLFGSFCPVFFDTIDNVPNNFDIWHHYFPPEWKITVSNSKRWVPRIILKEFLEWAQKRIFGTYEANYDKDLIEVVSGLFPSAHHSLFPAFLMLYFSGDIKATIKRDPTFSIINTGISWSGEKSDEEVQQMFTQQDLSQKQETVDLIYEYFYHWPMLSPFKEDMTEEEFAKWKEYSTEERKLIIDRIRRTKLQKALAELNSKEAVDIGKESERREHQRKIFVELMKLLIAKVT